MNPRLPLLLCGATLAPLTTRAQSVAGTPHVKLDLAASEVNGVVPFDQPFQLVGTPSAQLKQIYFWYAETTDTTQLSCTGINHDFNTLKNPQTNAGLRAKIRAIFKSITRQKPPAVETLAPILPQWTSKGAVNDSFRLAVDALEPNKDYGFCFRTVSTLSTADSTAFFGRVLRNLKSAALAVLAGADSSGTLIAFHQAVVHALPAGDTLVIPSGSFLDKDALQAEIAPIFAGYASANRNRIDVAAALTTASRADVSGPFDHLGQTLVGIGRAKGLDAFAQSAAKVDAKSYPNSAALAVGVSALIRLPALVADGSTMRLDEVTEVALGRRSLSALSIGPASPDQAVKLSAATDVTPWATNMGQTLATLTALQDYLTWLQAPGAVPQQATLDTATLNSLQTLIRLGVYQAQEQADRLDQLGQRLYDLDKAGSGLLVGATAQAISTVGVGATTFGDYKTRASWRVGQDLGVLMTNGGAQQLVPYAGVNIYFRPVNRSVHTPCPTADTFWRCVSLTLGVTTSSYQETGRYTGVLSGKAFVFGVGTRIGDFFRVSAMFPVIYRFTDGNAHAQQLGIRAGFGASIDADLLNLLGSVGKALFP